MRRHLVLAAMLLLATPAHAADPPRYVAGPDSGFQYDCEQAKQPVPRIGAFVTEVADLDGDGLPDHVIDAAKSCAASRALYCNDTEGCTISIYLSSWSGVAERTKARSWRIDRTAKPATLTLVTGGAACGGQAECTQTLRWTGERLLPVR